MREEMRVMKQSYEARLQAAQEDSTRMAQRHNRALNEKQKELSDLRQANDVKLRRSEASLAAGKDRLMNMLKKYELSAAP